MTKRQREKPSVRKQQIIEAAIKIAEEKGYQKVSRNNIGEKIGASGTVVLYHFGSMQQLKRALLRAAVKQENLVIIGQVLSARDSFAEKIPLNLKQKALGDMLC